MAADAKIILRGVNEKEEKAWSVVFTEYYAALCAYADKLIHDSMAVEDVVQDVFSNVWQSPRTFATVEDLTCYFYKATYNQALMYLRQLKNRQQYVEEMSVEQSEASDEWFAGIVKEELFRLLYLHVEKLPPACREVMRLSLKGYSGQEVADQLHITIHTVKTQKNRGFKFLRARLSESDFLILLIYYKQVRE